MSDGIHEKAVNVREAVSRSQFHDDVGCPSFEGAVEDGG
jgi:hypothetical protein